MTKRGDPQVLRLVVILLRALAGMTQEAFGKAARVDQGSLSRFELGKSAPSEEALRRMAAVARVRWPVVVHLRRVFGAVLSAVDRAPSGPGPDAALLSGGADEILLAVTPGLLAEVGAAPDSPSPEEARRRADEITVLLLPLPPSRRRRLVELTLDASRSWALAERLCHESARRASHAADDALELAVLAVAIAERVPGTESWRVTVLAYCQAFLGNARRVGNDFDGADAAFTKARRLWEAGSPADRARFAGWRMPDLEASLRREQHRFSDALALLDEALALAEPDHLAVSRILLNKEHVHERMGNLDAALATLAEAAPRVAAAGDPHLRFTLLFNTADTLGQVARFDEAAALLPEVGKLATRQGNGLDTLRVRWLEARLAAGQGRHDAAAATLEQVHRDFTGRKLPYDAALAALDLAVLHLEAGRTAEVRELAAGMAWIFEAWKIRREALASLRLFVEAARREAATVELARRAIAELKR